MPSFISETVKVIVRCRPMDNRELAMKCKPVIHINSERCTCSLLNPCDYSAPAKVFTFDGVYNENATTEQIYNEIAYSLIESVLDGYNSTIFAYGQTGCGKSFSMQGVENPDSQRGIIPRAFEHIFEAISLTDDYKYLVVASYLEIYNEEIRDLLGVNTKRKLDLKENPETGIYVNDLSYHTVNNVHECKRLMEQGWRNRTIGATLMNTDSSRSHSIFTISVEMMPVSYTDHCLEDLEYYTPIKRGKLNLVDLAGSERQAKTGTFGDRLKEATKINLSLSALGNVISALVDGKAKHIPYRDSKLTRLLKDSLGGNTKTLMVACLSPADNNYDETLSTLRYANRAKNIRNKPHVNEDPKDTILREYQEEIRKLRELLKNSEVLQQHNIDHLNSSDYLTQNFVKTKYHEYEKEMEKLKKQCEEEYLSKCQMEADLNNLKSRFNEETSQSMDHEKKKDNPPKINAAQLEILKRLEKLQSSIVGGECVNDRELKEKRLKKKKAAEQQLNALAKVLSKVEDDEGPNLMLKVYDDIQDELNVKSDLLRKYKQKVRALDREIQDLQSEFENERTDYLETIRKQERQLKLHNQILDNIVPVLSKECNYSNIERIREEATWLDELDCWQLPSLVNPRIKFPPATGDISKQCSQKTAPAKLESANATYAQWPSAGNFIVNNDLSSDIQVCGVCSSSSSGTETETANGCEINFNDCWSGLSSSCSKSFSPDSSVHRKFSLEQKYQKFDFENFAGNYFKPRRAAELLIQARENSTKSINKWKEFYNDQTKTKNFYDVDVLTNFIKSKHRSLNAQSLDINKQSHTRTRQTSPATYMTGNVHISPEMLPTKSTKIDLLPLIREKKNSLEKF